MTFKGSTTIINCILVVLVTLLPAHFYAQEKGVFSGGLVANGNFFVRDSVIGAANIPQYDNELFGSEVWLNLNYRQSGYDLRVRFDAFSNSNLLNPNDSYTAEGIGNWYIGKQLDKLGISVGYIYDQFGSGIIYRSFEQRPQLIDNALVGARLTYRLSENWEAKALVGRQKFLFGRNNAEIKGVSLEGFIDLGKEKRLFSVAPGVAYVNRTLDEESVDALVDIIKFYVPDEQVKPVFNTHLVSFFNTLSFQKFSLYTELAYKTPDVFTDPNATRSSLSGAQIPERFVKESGTVGYASLSYATKGLGVTLEGKRTENFDFRTDQTLRQNFGLINFIPPMNRLNTYRLTSRYSPATQMISEQALQFDVTYSPIKKLNIIVNGAWINDLDSTALYRELYTELLWKKSRNLRISGGVQIQRYNQELYEVKAGAGTVNTITPFADVLYKFSRKNSLRVEAQYMATEEDFGNWIYGLAEFGMAPHWIFEISGMYNITPSKKSPVDENGESLKILYPTLGITYIRKSNRFNLRYVKQVEGVVCSGGICRLEPAFSGVRMSVSSTF